jgi:tetratricopeptide (TPR) repeat protein
MKTKMLMGIAVVATASVVVLFGGVLGGSQVARPEGVADPAAAAGQLVAGFSPGDTGSYTAQLEARVAINPRDTNALVLLGLAYQQRVRETGDPSFYPRSATALVRAARLDPTNPLATTGLAALAASRHRFAESLALARRAQALNPESAAPYGIRGDALVELGRYRKAFAAFERMAALKPNLASYSRVAYARELLGDTRGAIAAMRLAVEAGAGTGEPKAWTLVQLGNLHFDTGRLGPAGHAYRQALAAFPGYVHAHAALARLAAARGRYGAAAALYGKAVARLPLPLYEGALGDVLRLAGRDDEARAAYGAVDAIQRLLQSNGVRTELETALFDLDHDRRLGDALERARIAFRKRKSIEAEDVLAWALFKNGRCTDARTHAVRALHLGTRDALKLFHRGMIEGCVGDRVSARSFLMRALAVNPNFSLLYAPVARDALR